MSAHDNKIKCKVDSCAYWGSGNQCLAREILVDNTWQGGAGKGDMELGRIGEGTGEAETSEDTCCETFAPRGEGRRRNQMRPEELER